MDVLVTGGGGFIGNHLVRALTARAVNVCVLDNLSGGNPDNDCDPPKNSDFTFIQGDLLNTVDARKAVEGNDVIFHLAANPEVRINSLGARIHYRQNVEATFNLLEAARKSENVKTFVFTSSSTVYGEASKIPTPEDYSPLEPISTYGATKLACEALVAGYAHAHDFNAVIYRLANVVGPRNKHGVVYDFVRKLTENPTELEILGDGNQTKSYICIDDCVEAMLLGWEKSRDRVEVYNIGSENQINVKTIARIVTDEMGLKDTKFRFTGGVDGGRGWKGDVKNMLLDVNKLKKLGWKPKLTSEEAVARATRDLLGEAELHSADAPKAKTAATIN